MGLAPDEPESGASIHETLRHESGFTMVQLLAEFRALRATVLLLCLPYVSQATVTLINVVLSFNEAIDQAVAESTARFTERTTQTRDLFLVFLGLVLRSLLVALAL